MMKMDYNTNFTYDHMIDPKKDIYVITQDML